MSLAELLRMIQLRFYSFTRMVTSAGILRNRETRQNSPRCHRVPGAASEPHCIDMPV